MVKEYGSMQLGIEKLKSISICGLFYQMVLDKTSPLFEIKSSNKYVLVGINNYFKWCEVKHVKEHIIAIVANFF